MKVEFCNIFAFFLLNVGLKQTFFENKMDFSSSSSSLPGGGLDANKKEQLMEQLKAQLAAANAQELLQVRVCLRMSI